MKIPLYMFLLILVTTMITAEYDVEPVSYLAEEQLFLDLEPDSSPRCVLTKKQSIVNLIWPLQKPCKIELIKQSNVCKIQVNFHKFDLDCINDFFFIDDIKYCGQKEGRIVEQNFDKDRMSIVYGTEDNNKDNNVNTYSDGNNDDREEKVLNVTLRQIVCKEDQQEIELNTDPVKTKKTKESEEQKSKLLLNSNPRIVPNLALDSNPVPKLSETFSSLENLNVLPIYRGHFRRTSTSSDLNCDQYYSSESFLLQSPNYPFPYPSSTDCKIVINAFSDDVCALELRFDEFMVQESRVIDVCDNDYLLVQEDDLRFCGLWSGIRRVPFNGNTKTLRFHSDSNTEDIGYSILITQIQCLNGTSTTSGGRALETLRPSPTPSLATYTTTSPLMFTALPLRPTTHLIKDEEAIISPDLVPIPVEPLFCTHSQVLSSSTLLLVSPSDSKNCLYLLELDPNQSICAIQLDFLTFDLSQNCNKEFLAIGETKRRFCGNLSGRSYVFPVLDNSKKFELMFERENGYFEIEAKSIKCDFETESNDDFGSNPIDPLDNNESIEPNNEYGGLDDLNYETIDEDNCCGNNWTPINGPQPPLHPPAQAPQQELQPSVQVPQPPLRPPVQVPQQQQPLLPPVVQQAPYVAPRVVPHGVGAGVARRRPRTRLPRNMLRKFKGLLLYKLSIPFRIIGHFKKAKLRILNNLLGGHQNHYHGSHNNHYYNRGHNGYGVPSRGNRLRP